MEKFIRFQEDINEELTKFSSSLPHYPSELYDAIKYILGLGGKRTRPLLVLIACDLFKGDREKAIPAALAIELFHNFTLVHDDIMDQAPLRRSKPTIHSKWNITVAILSGDAMMIKAYQLLNGQQNYVKEIQDLFSQTALKVCEGQQLDMNYEKTRVVSIAQYLGMIELKTAALLACSLKMGAIIGGASQKDANALYEFGKNIGLAFQLKDDILDVYGNSEKFGKQAGGDIIQNKKTYLLLKAMELSRSNPYKQEELLQWVYAPQFDPKQKVEAITEIYNFLDVKKLAEQEMQSFYNTALHELAKVSAEEESKQQLVNFANSLMNREI